MTVINFTSKPARAELAAARVIAENVTHMCGHLGAGLDGVTIGVGEANLPLTFAGARRTHSSSWSLGWNTKSRRLLLVMANSTIDYAQNNTFRWSLERKSVSPATIHETPGSCQPS